MDKIKKRSKKSKIIIAIVVLIALVIISTVCVYSSQFKDDFNLISAQADMYGIDAGAYKGFILTQSDVDELNTLVTDEINYYQGVLDDVYADSKTASVEMRESKDDLVAETSDNLMLATYEAIVDGYGYVKGNTIETKNDLATKVSDLSKNEYKDDASIKAATDSLNTLKDTVSNEFKVEIDAEFADDYQKIVDSIANSSDIDFINETKVKYADTKAQIEILASHDTFFNQKEYFLDATGLDEVRFYEVLANVLYMSDEAYINLTTQVKSVQDGITAATNKANDNKRDAEAKAAEAAANSGSGYGGNSSSGSSGSSVSGGSSNGGSNSGNSGSGGNSSGGGSTLNCPSSIVEGIRLDGSNAVPGVEYRTGHVNNYASPNPSYAEAKAMAADAGDGNMVGLNVSLYKQDSSYCYYSGTAVYTK